MNRHGVLKRGWGVLAGVPALFFAAWIIPLLPPLRDLGVCAARSFLGVDCPGCGLVRSFCSMAHGSLREGIHHHPMGPLIALWLLYLFARELLELLLARPLPPLTGMKSRTLLTAAFLAGIVLHWAAKLAICSRSI